jgi:SpoVK/Ycf46/Vps4 family AAA+-type ATPase
MNKSDRQILEPGSLMQRIPPAATSAASQVLQLRRLASETAAPTQTREVPAAPGQEPRNLVLFTGPSGAAKIMAAQLLAGEVGSDVFRIDTTQLVSKYIGETEKNLDLIFNKAADSNAVLFFDEADALFGRRSEVKDSHDRYANMEISNLLRHTRDYRGFVILACNTQIAFDRAWFVLDFGQSE